MPDPVVDFGSLALLLKASSKEQLRQILTTAFERRLDAEWPSKEAAEAIQADLGLETVADGDKLLGAVTSLVKLVLLRSGNILQSSSSSSESHQKEVTAQRLAALFPTEDSFHRNLRDLLVKLLVDFLPLWRRAAIEDLVGLPRLADFSWRVDLKSASDKINRMSEPACFVQMKVDERRLKNGEMSSRSVTVEFSQEQMNNMVQGLEKVKNQLRILSSQ